MKKGLIITLVILAVVVIGGCNMYKSFQNGINSKYHDVKAKWAEVQNMYQRRADLADQLVGTVKGAANHEKSTLESVIKARADATSMKIDVENLTPEKLKQFQQAQGELGNALSRLLVVQEKYPDLKANENFKDLQHQIEGTENRITKARSDYNLSVKEYNVKITNFPANLFASMVGFNKMPEFDAAPSSQRAPKIDFSN